MLKLREFLIAQAKAHKELVASKRMEVAFTITSVQCIAQKLTTIVYSSPLPWIFIFRVCYCSSSFFSSSAVDRKASALMPLIS